LDTGGVELEAFVAEGYVQLLPAPLLLLLQVLLNPVQEDVSELDGVFT
jgi:hypothetical protein